MNFSEEFNLSDKLDMGIQGYLQGALDVRDVKEFIRLLKDIDMFKYLSGENGGVDFDYKEYFEDLDKLAGDKLNGRI